MGRFFSARFQHVEIKSLQSMFKRLIMGVITSLDDI